MLIAPYHGGCEPLLFLLFSFLIKHTDYNSKFVSKHSESVSVSASQAVVLVSPAELMNPYLTFLSRPNPEVLSPPAKKRSFTSASPKPDQFLNVSAVLLFAVAELQIHFPLATDGFRSLFYGETQQTLIVLVPNKLIEVQEVLGVG